MSNINQEILSQFLVIYRSFARDKGWDHNDMYIIAEIHREVFANVSYQIIENILENNDHTREEVQEKLKEFLDEQFLQFAK